MSLHVDSDIARVRAFAAHASVALEGTRRQAAAQRAQVLDEDRQRVASAIHDTAIGRVSSASFGLHALLREDLPANMTDRIWETIDELDAAIRAIREAVFPSTR